MKAGHVFFVGECQDGRLEVALVEYSPHDLRTGDRVHVLSKASSERRSVTEPFTVEVENGKMWFTGLHHELNGVQPRDLVFYE